MVSRQGRPKQVEKNSLCAFFFDQSPFSSNASMHHLIRIRRPPSCLPRRPAAVRLRRGGAPLQAGVGGFAGNRGKVIKRFFVKKKPVNPPSFNNCFLLIFLSRYFVTKGGGEGTGAGSDLTRRRISKEDLQVCKIQRKLTILFQITLFFRPHCRIWPPSPPSATSAGPRAWSRKSGETTISNFQGKHTVHNFKENITARLFTCLLFFRSQATLARGRPSGRRFLRAVGMN